MLPVLMVLGSLLIWALYLLKLDERLPQLTLLRALLLLLIARIIDLTTFLIAADGEVVAREMNPVYQSLVKVISHEGAVVFTGAIGFLLIGAWSAGVWGLMGSKRLVLAFLVGCVVASLVGAASNVAYAVGIW